MWKNLDIYSRKSTIKPHVTLHSTCNAHTCTLFSHSKNNMWMYVEKFKHDSKKSTVKSRVALHSTWNAHACTLFPHNKINMWMHVEKCEHEQQINPQSNPVWHYIPHKMHMLVHYFHTTKSTCGCMWKSVNINSKKSTVKSRVVLHSTWNAHTCTLFSHNKNYVWMHVEKFKHKQQKIHSQMMTQIPCCITFNMKYTCLHIIFTRQE